MSAKVSDPPVLSRHRLQHIGELKVSEALWRRRYAADCSMARCSGHCCREGVLVGVEERDHILNYADLIRRHMDDDQQRDARAWFDGETEDPDFPGGRAVGTQLNRSGCVFLDRNLRCVLHAAEAELEPGVEPLKPFFCRAFPVCIEYGVLTIDDEHCPGESCCCGPVEDGTLTIFELCADELAFVLGAEGVQELQALVANAGSDEPLDGHLAEAFAMSGFSQSD